MKKLFLSVLMLSVVLGATSGFAAMQTYDRSCFETEDLRDDWTGHEGAWTFVDPFEPAVPGHKIYYGTYDYGNEFSASTFFNKNIEISTTNLSIGASFGVPGDGTFSGILFGSETDSGDYYSLSVRVASGDLYIYSNFWGSLSFIGSVDATDEGYYLRAAINDENLLSWYVYRKNSGVWADTPFAGGETGTLIDPAVGAVGLYTAQGPSGFGSFTMTYDDGSPVPVPGTMLLLGMGVIGLVGLKRKQK